MTEIDLVPADSADADAIAALHAESWRTAYRGLIPDEFLDHAVFAERVQLWRARLGSGATDRQLVLKALVDGALAGFVCVLLDAEPAYGPLLDNLHVRPALKGRGIGARLLHAAREWCAGRAPGSPMHLWVIEGNLDACRFYDRQGGTRTERRTNELTPGIDVTAVRYVWEALGKNS